MYRPSMRMTSTCTWPSGAFSTDTTEDARRLQKAIAIEAEQISSTFDCSINAQQTHLNNSTPRSKTDETKRDTKTQESMAQNSCPIANCFSDLGEGSCRNLPMRRFLLH